MLPRFEHNRLSYDAQYGRLDRRVKISLLRCDTMLIGTKCRILLLQCLRYIETAAFSETLVIIYQTTRRHFAIDRKLHIDRRENLKPHSLVWKVSDSKIGLRNFVFCNLFPSITTGGHLIRFRARHIHVFNLNTIRFSLSVNLHTL